jgi:hypothetical protein
MRGWGRFLPLVLLTLVVLLSVANGASKDDRPSKNKSKAAEQSEPAKHQEPQVPFPVWQATITALSDAIRTIDQQSKTADKQADAYRETYLSPPVVVNIALAIIGAGYLGFACLQWLSTRKTMRVTQRAYVNVSKVEMVAPETTDVLRFYRTAFVIRNSGRTPARNLLVQVGGEISEERFGENIPADIDKIKRATLDGMGLPPDIEHRILYEFPHAHLRADDVRVGKRYASCWATISYSDQFGTWHASIEPFLYNPTAQNFDRHIMGFKESSRRYRNENGYQRKICAWYRGVKKRLS